MRLVRPTATAVIALLSTVGFLSATSIARAADDTTPATGPFGFTTTGLGTTGSYGEPSLAVAPDGLHYSCPPPGAPASATGAPPTRATPGGHDAAGGGGDTEVDFLPDGTLSCRPTWPSRRRDPVTSFDYGKTWVETRPTRAASRTGSGWRTRRDGGTAYLVYHDFAARGGARGGQPRRREDLDAGPAGRRHPGQLGRTSSRARTAATPATRGPGVPARPGRQHLQRPDAGRPRRLGPVRPLLDQGRGQSTRTRPRGCPRSGRPAPWSWRTPVTPARPGPTATRSARRRPAATSAVQRRHLPVGLRRPGRHRLRRLQLHQGRRGQRALRPVLHLLQGLGRHLVRPGAAGHAGSRRRREPVRHRRRGAAPV